MRICLFMHARTPVRQRNENNVDGDEGKSDGRTKRNRRKRARCRECVCVCVCYARAHGGVWEREREGIQYNCTHVYRVDGNILERILKYLLVVWVEGERCLSRCHLDCAIEAPMRPPLQNLTIKIGLWEATEAVPSSSINGNGDRSTTCFTSSSWKSWNAVTPMLPLLDSLGEREHVTIWKTRRKRFFLHKPDKTCLFNYLFCDFIF